MALTRSHPYSADQTGLPWNIGKESNGMGMEGELRSPSHALNVG